MGPENQRVPGTGVLITSQARPARNTVHFTGEEVGAQMSFSEQRRPRSLPCQCPNTFTGTVREQHCLPPHGWEPEFWEAQ